MITADTIKEVITYRAPYKPLLRIEFGLLHKLTKDNCESLGVDSGVVDAGWDSVEHVADPTHGRVLCFWKSDDVNSVTTGWDYAYPRN